MPGPLPARYRLLEKLGEGGMGQVHRALDTTSGRTVVIKTLLERWPEPEALRRFQREARAAAAVAHPNVVRIFDADVEGARPYLVLEHVAGGSLQDRGQPAPPARAPGRGRGPDPDLPAGREPGLVPPRRAPGPARPARAGPGGRALDRGRAARPRDERRRPRARLARLGAPHARRSAARGGPARLLSAPARVARVRFRA